jgi:hypothetical protein
MFNSFRFWCFVGAILSLSTMLGHVFWGGPVFHQPALESAMSAHWKVAFSTVWHEITGLLFLNGMFLVFAALIPRKNLLTLWLVFLLNMAFACLFFGYGVARLGTPFVLVQWLAFVSISGSVGMALLKGDRLSVVEERVARPDHYAVLPHATFADTYLTHDAKFPSALEAARFAFGKAPGWISKLLALRNALVAPFGLVHEAPPQNTSAVGMFPILHASPEKVVLGLDDKHLDFRIVVELSADKILSMTTLVKTHNFLGKAYLALIMPFHRLIAATILAQAKNR